ncbi:Rv1733c family protein [Actinomycetospora chibensis]|uniref:Transmembrane protein n=1 Tax=Actinomycetospora chibensis TaxID=663606 RepID=A0ABV9RNR0_9PSEU|nr:hypothetical protein [Actinomycetospora chibensis]MDD7922207.1 hypothetical protein [Actinomycetospora chibensis]
MSDMTGPTRRIVGAFVPRRSALRRRSDRIEVGARWLLLLTGLLFLPVSLAIGSEVTAGLAPQVALQQAERHQVTAEVLFAPTDAQLALGGEGDSEWRAPVRWTAADGTARIAEVRVPPSALPGDPRVVWVDREDRLTSAPMTPSHPAAQGFLTAFFLVVSDLVVSLLLLAALRWVLDRWRLRTWETAWRRFTPPDHESMH